jgi:two-component system, chemotaxis family, protein-glutamate methylesterase/glutaminase
VTARPTRVLVCEDSRTFAAALTRALEHGGEIEVVGVRSSAEAAIADLARLSPDLITMDIELPGMSGLAAVEQIMSTKPTPILVLSSHVTASGETAAAALAAGALEAVGKDDLPLLDPAGAAAAALRRRVRLLSRARVIHHPRARLGERRSAVRAGTLARRALAIGICASTGGPQALVTVLAALPASFTVPIFVVQHISAGFTEGLARWLDGVVPLPVRIAEDGACAEAGVTIAPEGAHLCVRDGVLELDRRSPAGLHRPSADMLLRSLADSAKRGAVAVVLTGMGRDGAEGSAAVRAAGGLVIAQDQRTSAVYGMPQETAKRGADLVLPLDEIAGALIAVGQERRAGGR